MFTHEFIVLFSIPGGLTSLATESLSFSSDTALMGTVVFFDRVTAGTALASGHWDTSWVHVFEVLGLLYG